MEKCYRGLRNNERNRLHEVGALPLDKDPGARKRTCCIDEIDTRLCGCEMPTAKKKRHQNVCELLLAENRCEPMQLAEVPQPIGVGTFT